MSRIWVTAAAVLGILAGALLGCGYWVGLQAQSQYRGYLERASSRSSIRLTDAGYRRGWLTSEAVTQVDVTLPEDTESGARHLTFALQHRIYHGPLPLGQWRREGFSARPVQAVVHTRLTGDAGWITRLKALYGRREPLAAISTIALDGSIETRLTMPALDIDDQGELASLLFSGLEGRLWLAAGGRALKGELTVAVLRGALKAPAGAAFRVRGLRLSVDQRQGRFQWLTGDSALRLDELQWRDLDTGAVSLSGVALLAQVSERDERVDSRIEAGIDEIALAGRQRSEAQVHLALALRRLDGALLERLQQWRETHPDAAGAAADEGLGLLQALLQGHPELALQAQVRTSQGELQAVAEGVLQNPGVLSWDYPAGLVRALASAQAQASVTKTLLETVLLAVAKDRVRAAAAERQWQPDETVLAELAGVQVEQQLAGLKAFNLIQPDGDRYQTKMRVQDGWLSLNGKDIPLLF